MLQGLPMLLSSPQYIVQPAQTVLKPTKNARILPNTSKITTPISTVHSISNGTALNTLLLPKPTLLNNFAILNATSSTAPTLINNSIQFSQLRQASQASIQTGKVKHIVAPVRKSINSQSKVFKKTQTIVPSNVNSISNSLLASTRSIANQIQNTALTKTPSPHISSKINSSMILKNSSIVKTQDVKITASPTSVLRTTSSSISILKPQPKPNVSKSILNLQSLGNLNNSSSQKIFSVKQNGVTEQILGSQKLQEVSNKIRTLNSANLAMQNFPLNGVKKIIPASLKPTKLANEKLNMEKLSSKTGIVNNCITKQNSTNSAMANLSSPKALTASPTTRIITVNPTTRVITVNPTTRVVTVNPSTTRTVTENHHRNSITKPIITKARASTENPIDIILQGELSGCREENVVFQVVYPENANLETRNLVSLPKQRAKRGRPRKNANRPQILPTKPIIQEENQDIKDERKVIARTRSGRLSRPPRHMVKDYKHLHHLDFMQPDVDDSDGGYSDYNTNGEKLENGTSPPTELLPGLESPKRKHARKYQCPGCGRCYLGRKRVLYHLRNVPSHGDVSDLPPPSPREEEIHLEVKDTLKRKSKKVHWTNATPHEKSLRRQEKLREAIAICRREDENEVITVAAKPVVELLPLYDLMMLKAENNTAKFLKELKGFLNTVREKSQNFVAAVSEEDKSNSEINFLEDPVICEILGLNPGEFKINVNTFAKEEINGNKEPPMKKIKMENEEDVQNQLEEKASSGFSEISDISSSSTCPEVFAPLTLIPRNSSPSNESCKATVLISNPQIQNELSENSGFLRVEFEAPKISGNLDFNPCSEMVSKSNNSFDQSNADGSFRRLEPTHQQFINIVEATGGSYRNHNEDCFDESQNFEVQNLNTDTGNSMNNQGILEQIDEKQVNDDSSQIDDILSEEAGDMITDFSLELNASLTEEFDSFNRSIRS